LSGVCTEDRQAHLASPHATIGHKNCARFADTDRAFIKMAASSGQAEIQLGKLAAERADRSDVRDFAKHLEKDHTQAGW
jgi:predicted outer membrane protein